MQNKNIYWVTTPCNIENWFIISTSEQEAKNLHEDGEGFDRGYARAKKICTIPNELLENYVDNDEDDYNYWPSLELLKELDFRIIERESPRIVSYKSKIYYEGSGMIKIVEYHTSRFSGMYVVNVSNTDKYKIGFTKNLDARLKAIRTMSPNQIRLRFYIITKHYKELEKEIHKMLSSKLIRREWFSLNEDDIDQLTTKFLELDKEKFRIVDYKSFPFYM